MQNSSSKLLDKAVGQFASLPGIGRKTALKFVLYLLKKSPEEVKQFIIGKSTGQFGKKYMGISSLDNSVKVDKRKIRNGTIYAYRKRS